MMIGKINSLNFKYLLLVLLLTLSIAYVTWVSGNVNLFLTFIIALIAGLIATKYGIQIIKFYNFLQTIKIEGPASHSSKKNTPTMGGLFFIGAFLIYLVFQYIFTDLLELQLLFFIGFSYYCIGFLDDFLSIKKNTNLGLKGREKLFLQSLFTAIFITLLYQNQLLNTQIVLFNNSTFDIGLLIIPLSFFTVISLSNAINLTDGIDGLAAGCSSIAFFGLGTEIIFKNNENHFIYALLCYVMSGLCLGFLKLNIKPARIFMGDIGSLSLGAILGSICVLSNSFVTTFLFSGVFFIETISVIMQVTYFKVTKRILGKGQRIFKMSPLHHHYELTGVKEEKIVENFWKINILLVILGIVLEKSF